MKPLGSFQFMLEFFTELQAHMNKHLPKLFHETTERENMNLQSFKEELHLTARTIQQGKTAVNSDYIVSLLVRAAGAITGLEPEREEVIRKTVDSKLKITEFGPDDRDVSIDVTETDMQLEDEYIGLKDTAHFLRRQGLEILAISVEQSANRVAVIMKQLGLDVPGGTHDTPELL